MLKCNMQTFALPYGPTCHNMATLATGHQIGSANKIKISRCLAICGQHSTEKQTKSTGGKLAYGNEARALRYQISLNANLLANATNLAVHSEH